mmetsp:Transcript_4181/g.4896  ORF Transcript_4181/g.4896 Transcript_4181/m.4896 type:complete len:234 (-) Transcript_4181:227-928(-)|eukprot:CAMPEP_0185773824 /NCGR_PEP_ID=MMETSP1174-20130828/75246_1 /TAXON_ID=35687 /ORGANISM="Dictyocha speculum, Strain CCMP1381" /LENGTH=233 /DNA_ID=CAMNT_0028460685 /DNA_START=139 /DNA_END=840 /DNA_ORIENTATION=-
MMPMEFLASDDYDVGYVVLPNLLNALQIAACLEAAETYPHMCELAKMHGGPCAGLLCDALEGLAHSYAAINPGDNTSQHIVLNLHQALPGAEDTLGFLQEFSPELCATLFGAMASPPPHWGCGTLRQAAELRVRCIELHTYAPGGGLLDPKHHDGGSVLSLSVLLSDPLEHHGGRFITYDADGAPVVHELARGDAVLFRSEDRHNVSVVTQGVRQSLVVELWDGPTCVKDRTV